jgi:alkaline phosphatase D
LALALLGQEQERWLARGFGRSTARWNIVAQQLLVAELEHLPYEDERYWNDAWDGYPLARRRILAEVVRTRLENPVFLTGDWHSTFVNDLKLDFKDPRARTVATEFVTPAITTGGDSTPYGPYYAPMVPYNPHISYYEGDRRGYFKATITPELMKLDLRFMTSVERDRIHRTVVRRERRAGRPARVIASRACAGPCRDGLVSP